MNTQQQDQFYQMMTNSRSGSRAVSSSEDRRITEVVNGLIVTRPAKKITYLSPSETKQTTEEPEIIELTKSKAGSVPAVNKLQEIVRFQRSNGRL